MDKEKENQYVTHSHLNIIEKELRKEIIDGDKENLKLITNVDSRVDSIAIDVRGMKVSSENTERNTEKMVELMKEQKQDAKELAKKTSETNKRMFEKIEKNSEDIIKISSDFKAFNEKRDKDWKLKTVIIGGTFSLGVGIFNFLKGLTPIVEHYLFGK